MSIGWPSIQDTSRRSWCSPVAVTPAAISDPSSAARGTGTSNGRPAATAWSIASFSAWSSARDSPCLATLSTNRPSGASTR